MTIEISQIKKQNMKCFVIYTKGIPKREKRVRSKIFEEMRQKD